MVYERARNGSGGRKIQVALYNRTWKIERKGVILMCAYMLLTDYKCSDDQPYIPPTKPYELSVLAVDLVLFARYMLKSGGRLVFFLPTVTDEYAELDVQAMLCDGMEIIANSLQDFGSWGRRVCVVSCGILRLD